MSTCGHVGLSGNYLKKYQFINLFFYKKYIQLLGSMWFQVSGCFAKQSWGTRHEMSSFSQYGGTCVKHKSRTSWIKTHVSQLVCVFRFFVILSPPTQPHTHSFLFVSRWKRRRETESFKCSLKTFAWFLDRTVCRADYCSVFATQQGVFSGDRSDKQRQWQLRTRDRYTG